MKRLIAIVGGGIAVMLGVLALLLGGLQTGPGKAWLADAIGAALSDASGTVTVSRITGFVPFDLHVGEIVIADRDGPRLRVENAAITISARDLLARRLNIRTLTIAKIAILRRATGNGSTDLPALLHPALPVTLGQFDIGALVLGQPVLGTAITLAVSGNVVVGDGQATAKLALDRSDGTPGSARLELAYGGGAAPRLHMSAQVSEPTGTVLAALLHRSDKLPLAVKLAGDGPVAAWQGELDATAGSAASLTAKFQIAGTAPYHLSVTGDAQVASLLPPAWRALAGDRIALAANIAVASDAVAVDRLSLTSSGFSVAAQGHYESAGDAIAATAHIALPELMRIAPSLSGAGTAEFTLGGTLARPIATADMAVMKLHAGDAAIETATASLRIEPAGDLPAATLRVTASGHVGGLAREAAALPAGLGEALDWRIDGTIDPRAATAAATISLTDQGATATADVSGGINGAAGELRVAVPDLAPFDGGALAGALDAAADFRAGSDGTATAVLSGTIAGPTSSSVPRLGAMLGDRVTFAVTLVRGNDGTITASDIAADSGGARLTGSGQIAGAGTIAADFDLTLPRLAALDPRLTGAATLSGHLAGPVEKLAGAIALAAPALTITSLRIAGLKANLTLSGSTPLAGQLAARFSTNGIDTTVMAKGALAAGGIRLPEIAVAAAGARLQGAFTLGDGRAEGKFHGTVPDFRPWSSVAGVALAGRATIDGRIAGNRYTATLDGSEMSLGGASPARARHVVLSADVTDPFGRPAGQASLAIADAAAGRVVLGAANIGAKSDRAGHFALTATAHGALGETFTLSAGASLGIERDAAALTIARLGGTIGPSPYSLGAPLAIAWRDGTLKFSGLKLAFDKGRISGDGMAGGKKLALHLVARALPVQKIARLGGADVAGTLGFELTLAGTRAAPQGHLVLDGEGLRFAVASRPDLPPFGAVVEADWRSGHVGMKGRLAGPQKAAIGWTATVPLVLEREAIALDVPRTGAIAAHLEGAGELGAFADLLPDAEDRVTGHFTIDVSVAGTVGNPAASGHIAVTDGRYESFATGAILTGVNFTLEGERDRLVLRNFAANDGAGGSLTMSGAVDLAAAAGPTLALTATLEHLRALNRDEAKATASGELRISGTIAAPRVDAALTIDNAELAVPDRVASSVQPVAAVVIDSATGTTLSAATPQQPPPLLALTLNVTVALPGKTFVRGRGLDSEWRGHLVVSGTAAAPSINGRLEVARGTFDLLSKTFVLNGGTITFLGGRTIDPTIDIQATAQSSDITAIVTLTGTAKQPTIKLSSTPPLPNDEILSRLLFGTSMSQIGPAQGVEIASAAASLTGGGNALDVLGKLRRGLGLDRLALGSAPGSVVPGIGVPSLSTQPGQTALGPATGLGTAPLAPGATSTGGLAGGTALNAGKYVANGVYVGVSQGLQPGSSTANVTVDVSRHITVDTEAGQTSGAGIGIGVNWKLDY